MIALFPFRNRANCVGLDELRFRLRHLRHTLERKTNAQIQLEWNAETERLTRRGEWIMGWSMPREELRCSCGTKYTISLMR